MIGVSKTFGGSSILSSPARKVLKDPDKRKLKDFFHILKNLKQAFVYRRKYICVVSNALILKAVFRESPIKVDPACYAGTAVEAHGAALTVMRSCQINMV